MLGNLDPAKILIILVLALVVLGPERLPKAARQLGAAWRELTRVREQVAEEVRSAIPELGELPKIPSMKPGAISGFLNDLTKPPASSAASTRAALSEAGAGVTGEVVGTTTDGIAEAGAGSTGVPASEVVSRVDGPALGGALSGRRRQRTEETNGSGVTVARGAPASPPAAAAQPGFDDPAMN